MIAATHCPLFGILAKQELISIQLFQSKELIQLAGKLRGFLLEINYASPDLLLFVISPLQSLCVE